MFNHTALSQSPWKRSFPFRTVHILTTSQFTWPEKASQKTETREKHLFSYVEGNKCSLKNQKSWPQTPSLTLTSFVALEKTVSSHRVNPEEACSSFHLQGFCKGTGFSRLPLWRPTATFVLMGGMGIRLKETQIYTSENWKGVCTDMCLPRMWEESRGRVNAGSNSCVGSTIF